MRFVGVGKIQRCKGGKVKMRKCRGRELEKWRETENENLDLRGQDPAMPVPSLL
jgi:hypothetical protein